MSEFQILLTVIISGFGFMGSILMVIWNKIEKLDEKLTDVDRRVCRIEGSLQSHGHCLFNQAKPEQKAQ